MKPEQGLLQGRPYTPAAKTDISKTFRRIIREREQAKKELDRKLRHISDRVRVA